MASITLLLTPQQISQIQSTYQPYLETPVAHAYFRARKNQTVITAYKSGKVLFQGAQAQDEARHWQVFFQLTDSTPQKESVTPHQLDISSHSTSNQKKEARPPFDKMTIIGADEAGTGDFFGPATFCAAYVTQDKVALLKEYGVCDSKSLSDTKIKEIANLLVHTIPFHITVVAPEQYNALHPLHNANGIKALGHNRTLLSLWQRLTSEQQMKLEATVLDEFANAKLYQKYIQKELHTYPKPITFVQKGESHSIAVAAASILARAAFVQQMAQLGKPYGKSLPLGAGPTVDSFGKRLVSQHGPGILSSLSKQHFSNTQKILG